MTKIRHLSLLTDFGLQDVYVGVMHGVIESIAPHIKVTDLCHGIPPQKLPIASLMLASVAPYFSPATLHVVVIDPGVGSKRRILYAKTQFGHFLAPDNGVLTGVLELDPRASLVHVTNQQYMLPHPSSTFHGRDIFSPVAAHLAAGVPAQDLGPSIDDPVTIEALLPTIEAGELRGKIVYIDHFGNCITNIPRSLAARISCLEVPSKKLSFAPLCQSYSEVEGKQALLLVNSFEVLEIAVNRGNAARQFGLIEGDPVLAPLDRIDASGNPVSDGCPGGGL